MGRLPRTFLLALCAFAPLFSAFLRPAAFSLASIFLMSGQLHADEQRELKTGESDKLDAVLVLDTSGSMLATDPQGLRIEGAKLFLNLLRPDDRIAVVAFDREARVIAPFSAQSDEAAKQSLFDKVQKLPTSGEFTDLLSAVEVARDLLKREKRPGATGVVLLLSDGKMDPDPKIGTASFRSEQLLNGVLPELKASSVKVHTLYFSEQADKQLLGEIALATEGAASFASSTDLIHKSFADLFLAVKKPQVVPLTGRGFQMDGDVQEATFYLNRVPDQDLVLFTPSAKEIRPADADNSIKWFVGKRFDVVTISTPEPGMWRVQGLASADSFATVLTNLKLVSDWPNSVTAGTPTLLQVRLNDGDKPVVLPEVSTNTRYGVQIIPTDKVAEPVLEEPLFDDGTSGDKIAGDGIFSRNIQLDSSGDYRMWLVAKGPTFDRRQQLPFKVKPPLIEIVTEMVAEGHGSHEGPVSHAETKDADGHGDVQNAHGTHTEGGGAHHEEHAEDGAKHDDGDAGHDGASEQIAIFVRLSSETLAFKNIKVSLVAIDDGRKRYIIPVERGHEPTEYEVPIKAFPHDGVYTLEATLTAENRRKGAIEVQSQQAKVTIVRGVEAPPVTAVVVQDQQEPEAPATSPWPFAGGILLLNGAAIGYLFTLLKKQQGPGARKIPDFVPTGPAEEFIAALQARAEITEIDPEDPELAPFKSASDGASETASNSSAATEAASEIATATEDTSGSGEAGPGGEKATET